ncbi:PREDICTED: uncharacterized protein LOC105584086 isoform X2 [Cercocebus atys]|uniref:uncharacterized protein LOC105584086 isoform X2 n=1 Tax=Cercocebus atys TaxID=9531 RepID=UPI0005F3CB1D|nr:PREDICTED: uncharacterized protein LOC105584086 isoform X2 [Cercocebus atys]
MGEGREEQVWARPGSVRSLHGAAVGPTWGGSGIFGSSDFIHPGPPAGGRARSRRVRAAKSVEGGRGRRRQFSSSPDTSWMSFNSIHSLLTLSTWDQHQTRQVKGSVPQDFSHFRCQSQMGQHPGEWQSNRMKRTWISE